MSARKLHTLAEVFAAGAEAAGNRRLTEAEAEDIAAILAPVADRIFTRVSTAESVSTLSNVDVRMDIYADESASERAA